MIDWVQIKETAASLIADLSDLGRSRIQWRDEAESASWTNDPTIYLSVRDLRDLDYGQELRGNTTDINGVVVDLDQTVNVAVQKMFTLSVRCESFSQDLADGRHAGAILSKLGTRLCRSTTAERLRGIFAVTDSTPPLNISAMVGGRKLCVYTMDLFCATVDNDTDDTMGAGDYIDEIEINGTVNDAGALRTINLDIKGS